jgi:hypothetical protein
MRTMGGFEIAELRLHCRTPGIVLVCRDLRRLFHWLQVHLVH